ncbi:hypothetical protein ACOMHN_042332 [Nucella lapillus]
MPLMVLSSNLKNEAIPKDFEMELCTKLGEVLNKPMEKITLTVHTGVRQMRAGSPDPMASLDIYSIGVFDEARNPTYTTSLLPFLCQKLKLPEKRVVLLYHDIQLSDVGLKMS